VPLAKFNEECMNLPLTGKYFGLSYIDMTYLFFELEKELGVRINEKYLYNYGFNTINKITSALTEFHD